MKDSKVPLKEILLLIAGWLALVILQLIFKKPPFYDEDEYLSNVGTASSAWIWENLS